MIQHGQVFRLGSVARDGGELWAYRYRTGGRDSKRVQRGGFRSEADARAALERALEKQRRRSGVGRRLTLAEFVDEYLAQHEVSPVTLEKLRFLLSRAVKAFGGYCLDELDPVEISAWRMTVPPGYRFEATQALRQVLARAVVWGMLDVNPAKQGVENPQRKRTEKRPFESWEQLEALAERLGPRLGPMVLFAAATGMRPGEWVALEDRDIDRAARVAYVNRSFGKGRLTTPKTEASIRAVPLQARALAALDQLQPGGNGDLLFPADRGGYIDLHNFRNRDWKPAQLAVGIEPFRAHLRSQAHLRDVRPGCRHLHLRPLALHGRQPDRDRPPLRPPYPRRPRARDPSARRAQRPRGGRSWTLGGRRNADAPPDQTTKEAAEQAIIEAL